MWGEFGRTPRINRGAGRDHWSPVMSAMIAGGGLRWVKRSAPAPRAASVRRQPRHRVARPRDDLPGRRHRRGADVPNNTGRPMHILDDRMPIRELLG